MSKFFAVALLVAILAISGFGIMGSTNEAKAEATCQYGFNVSVSNVEKPSVHPGTTVTVTTDVAELVLYDVESEAGKVTTGYVAGTTIVNISVQAGPDGKHSVNVGTDIHIECEDPTPTPTNTPTDPPVDPTATPSATPTDPPVEPSLTPTASATPTNPPSATPTFVPSTQEPFRYSWPACDAKIEDVGPEFMQDWLYRCSAPTPVPTEVPEVIWNQGNGNRASGPYDVEGYIYFPESSPWGYAIEAPYGEAEILFNGQINQQQYMVARLGQTYGFHANGYPQLQQLEEGIAVRIDQTWYIVTDVQPVAYEQANDFIQNKVAIVTCTISNGQYVGNLIAILEPVSSFLAR